VYSVFIFLLIGHLYNTSIHYSRQEIQGLEKHFPELSAGET